MNAPLIGAHVIWLDTLREPAAGVVLDTRPADRRAGDRTRVLVIDGSPHGYLDHVQHVDQAHPDDTAWRLPDTHDEWRALADWPSEADEIQAAAEQLAAETTIERFGIEGGALSATLNLPPRLRALFIELTEWAAQHAGENYVEQGVTFTLPANPGRWTMAFALVRPGRLTPHQLRQQANARADALEQLVMDLLDQGEITDRRDVLGQLADIQGQHA